MPCMVAALRWPAPGVRVLWGCHHCFLVSHSLPAPSLGTWGLCDCIESQNLKSLQNIKLYLMYSNIDSLIFSSIRSKQSPNNCIQKSHIVFLIVDHRRLVFRVAAAAALDSITNTTLSPIVH